MKTLGDIADWPQPLDPEEALAWVISEVSEEQYCAGWMFEVEYDLWAIVSGRINNRYGLGPISTDLLATVKEIQAQANGWIVWPRGAPRVFLTMEEWLPMFEDWAKDKPLRMLSEAELTQIEDEMLASWKAPIFDMEARQKEVEKMQAEKGYTKLARFYLP